VCFGRLSLVTENGKGLIPEPCKSVGLTSPPKLLIPLKKQFIPVYTFQGQISVEGPTYYVIELIEKYGEPDRIRTCDPLIKSQLLYLLSYGPTRAA